jgi:hypothetical protein
MKSIKSAVHHHKIKKGIDLKFVHNFKRPQDINSKFLCGCCDKFVFGVRICHSCQTYYCENCILNRLNNKCSNCQDSFISEKIPEKDLKELSYYYFDCLNKHKGCKMQIYFEVFADHLELCLYEDLLCMFPKCIERVSRKDYLEHIDKCNFHIIQCKHCKLYFAYNKFKKHLSECPERFMECFGCHSLMQNKFLKGHYSVCDKVELICEECGFEFNKMENEEHSKTHCLLLKMINFKNHLLKVIKELRMKIKELTSQYELIRKLEKYYCANCFKKSCEVALRHCHHCKQKYCTTCAKDQFISCVKCLHHFCSNCSVKFDIKKTRLCKDCISQKK